MNIQRYKKLLLAREQEFTAEITRFDAEARESRTAEVEDPIDLVTSDESKAANFKLGDVAVRNLQQVRAALQRIEAGTYGVCVDCGSPIESARLDAVPWTPYCLEDQEKHDGAGESEEESGLSAIA